MPKKNEQKELRQTRVSVVFTENEAQRLRVAAALQGKTLSAFVGDLVRDALSTIDLGKEVSRLEI